MSNWGTDLEDFSGSWQHGNNNNDVIAIAISPLTCAYAGTTHNASWDSTNLQINITGTSIGLASAGYDEHGTKVIVVVPVTPSSSPLFNGTLPSESERYTHEEVG